MDSSNAYVQLLLFLCYELIQYCYVVETNIILLMSHFQTILGMSKTDVIYNYFFHCRDACLQRYMCTYVKAHTRRDDRTEASVPPHLLHWPKRTRSPATWWKWNVHTRTTLRVCLVHEKKVRSLKKKLKVQKKN